MTHSSNSGKKPGVFASPPCFLHEIDPDYAGLAGRDTAKNVARWRREERKRLVALRLALPAEVRRAHGERIAHSLDELLGGEIAGATIAVYWPIRAEPDLRGWMARIAARGGNVLLPVVVEKDAPLIFRRWRPGCAMARGVWNIPVPADGAEAAPDIVISPVVGFDARRYRLGNGGGYYDRTLAIAPGTPRVIGVGYSALAIATIYPQDFDIPMDEIVTETGRMA